MPLELILDRLSGTLRLTGTDFVRCRLCGDHRRVISGRHLSQHGTDPETYMQQYRLSLDALCAQDFRRLVSSRAGYYPHHKARLDCWIKTIYKCERQVFAGYIQDTHPHIYDQGLWIFGIGDTALRAAGF
jgi:hypothetical protein